MRGLIKFTLLIFAFCLKVFAIGFANIHISFYDGRTSFPSSSTYKKVNDVEFLSNSYLRIGNLVYSYSTSGDNLFNLFLKKGDGFYSDEGMSKLEFYDSSHEKYTVYCESNTARSCSFEASTSYPAPVEFSYFKTYYISYFVTCPADQHFNTDTKRCQKCKENESWDPETNTCYNDCNKEGKPNKLALTDGRCIDCSGEKTAMSVLNCFCLASGHGSGKHYSYKKDVDSSASPCSLVGECIDGELVNSFFDPSCKPDDKPDPKPDDNKTKPDDPKPDDPKPDNPDDPDNKDRDKDKDKDKDKDEFCKKNPDDPKCKPDDFCKKNPSDPKCKPDDNKTSPGGGGGGSVDNVKFKEGDFKYDDLKSGENDFTSKYSQAISDATKNFHTFKNGVDQFIENVKGNGLNDISKKDIPKTCSHKETIDFFGHSIDIDFDFCKIVAPASGAFYYLFYVFFFGCFLFLIIKLLILSF